MIETIIFTDHNSTNKELILSIIFSIEAILHELEKHCFFVFFSNESKLKLLF